MKYNKNELLKRSIRNSIALEKGWLIAMANCHDEEDIKVKEESAKFIRVSIEYYENRWGEKI